MSSDLSKSCIESLKQMQKSENLDNSKTRHLITNLQKSGELNETNALLFELILRENFNCHAKINELTKTKADVKPEPNPKACTNCGNDQFTQYLATLNIGSSGMGMNQHQSVGDLGVKVCTKCKICTFLKPTYWN